MLSVRLFLLVLGVRKLLRSHVERLPWRVLLIIVIVGRRRHLILTDHSALGARRIVPLRPDSNLIVLVAVELLVVSSLRGPLIAIRILVPLRHVLPLVVRRRLFDVDFFRAFDTVG